MDGSRVLIMAGASLLWHLLLALHSALPVSGSLSGKTLKVLSVTPSADSARSSMHPPKEVMLSGRQAITVTFNRAFIALGSDYGTGSLPPDLTPLQLEPSVPGHMHWVTTSVMRFDPSGDWPAELNLKLRLHAGITSYDGASVDDSLQHQWQFRTPAFHMHVSSVHSKRAKQLTAGRWNPGSIPEVPPDGIVQLSFTSDVELDLLQKNLQLLLHQPGNSSRVSFDLGECKTGAGPRCVWLTPSGDGLQARKEYELVLPTGSRFHKHAGLTQRRIAVKLHGLHGFDFKLRAEDVSWFRPCYRRLRLWLRHGLEEDTDLKSVSKQFEFSPTLPFVVTHPELAVLQIEAEFQPDTKYTLEVTASEAIRDGFGLPLQASKGIFRTASLQSFFLEPGVSEYYAQDAMLNSNRSEEWNMLAKWPVIARGRKLCVGQDKQPEVDCEGGQPQRIEVVPIQKGDVQKTIASLRSQRNVFVQSSEAVRLEAPLQDEAKGLHISIADSLKHSGLALHTRWTRNGYQPKVSSLLGSPSMVAAFIATSDGLLNVWVLRSSDNAAVAHASVTAFGFNCWGDCQPDDVTPVATGTTDENGVAHLHISDVDLQLAVAVVKEDEPLLLQTDVPRPLKPPADVVKGQLLTDRGVYKPLDAVLLKGYVRLQVGQQLRLPSSDSIHSLTAQWTPGGKLVSVPISLDSEFGSFHANLSVPADAQFGDHVLELVQVNPPPHDYPQTISTVQVTVADPRPPTVSLSVEAEKPFLPPGGELPLRMATSTLSGVPMANASVKLTWRLQRRSSNTWWADPPLPTEEEEDEQDESSEKEGAGEDQFSTGENGKAHVSWRLPQSSSRRERTGDSVSLRFEWVGPTRELLSQQLTVPVARSELTLDLSVPSPGDALPGQPLSVTAALRKRVNLEGATEAVLDMPVSISVYRVANQKADAISEVTDGGPESLPQASEKVHQCHPVEPTASTAAASCEIRLPAMGRYLVAACTTQEDRAEQLCSVVPVGRTEAEWEKNPLGEFLQQATSGMFPDKQRYRAGDVPRLKFHNPLDGLRALVKWGNRLSFRTTVTSRLPVGPAEVQLEALREECDGGCQVWILLCAPSNSTRELPVPTSLLLDVSGPQSASHTLSISVAPAKAQELSVVLKPDHAVQKPGSQAGFTISVHHADGSPADGEVTVFAVDQAFLNLQPHAPVNLSHSLAPDTGGGQLDHIFSHAKLVSARGLNFSTHALMQLLHADPWLLDGGTEWPLRPTPGSSAQLSLKDMLRAHTFDLTEMPWATGQQFGGGLIMPRGGAPMLMARSAAPVTEMAMMAAPPTAMAEIQESDADKMNSVASNDVGKPAAKAMPLRANFIVTPLFLPTLQVHAGSAHVKWALPDNIGSFELRAYAVSKKHEFGGGSTTQQVVRKAVSLSPSVPRIVRVGDTFKGGVTLTVAPGQSELHVLKVKMHVHGSAVTLDADAESAGDSELQQKVHVGAGQTVEVAFELLAASLGNVTLVVSASDTKGELLDALRIELTVLGAQPEVQVATSFAVTASAPPALPWQEGLVLPASANGSGHLSVIAGVGRQPAVQNLAAALLRIWERDEAQEYHSANTLLCAAATAALLIAYPDASAKKLRDAKEHLASVAHELAKLTNRKGLHYSAAALVSSAECDLFLNAFALYVLRRLRLAGVKLPNALSELELIWKSSLEQGLQTYATRMLRHKPHTFADWDVLAAARLALGSHWQPAHFESLRHKDFQELQSALSMERLLESVDSLSVFSKASVVLLLLLPENSALAKASLTRLPKEVRSVLDYLASTLRITARTAYVADSLGSQHAAGIGANGLVLSALAVARHLSAEQLPFSTGIDKLANYVAEGAGLTASAGSVSLLHMAFGLVDYDQASGNTDANLDFVALAGYEPLLTLKVDAASGQTPLSFETPWDRLPNPPPPLLFKAEGRGEVSVAVTLRFVPPVQIGHSAPVYRGIDVQKIVQLYDTVLGRPHGPQLTAVSLGSVVTVTLQVTTNDDLRGVSIEDWLPAGLEALDPNLGNGHASANEPTEWCWLWYLCPFFHRETKKDRVTFYSSWLSAGTHTLRYEAIAATLGSFVLPPGRASVTLQPEVMGMSVGGQLQVMPSTVNPQDIIGIVHKNTVSIPAPKRCPGDCMGQGECDTASGKCHCNPGSSGANCSSEARQPEMQPFTGYSGEVLDELRLVAGSKEVGLIVKLLAQGLQEVLSPSWMFASSTDFLDARKGDTGAQRDVSNATLTGSKLLSLEVIPGKREVVLSPPQEVPRALTGNVTVSASADGRLFASRRLSVQLYPQCVPGSSVVCDCHSHGNAAASKAMERSNESRSAAEARGKKLCSAEGFLGICECLDYKQPRTDDSGGLQLLYLAALPICLIFCCHAYWKRINSRTSMGMDSAPLFGGTAGQDTELSRREGSAHSSSAASLLQSRGETPSAGNAYWHVADVAE